MAVKYLPSASVKVFPSAFRVDNDPESFLMSENNITNISKKTSLFRNYAHVLSNGNLGICLSGYYFEASISDITTAVTPGSATKIYVGIRIDDLASSYSGVYIPTLVSISGNSALDVNSEFVGLCFSTTLSDLSDCTYKLLLLVKEDSTWKLNPGSIIDTSFDEVGINYVGSAEEELRRVKLSDYLSADDTTGDLRIDTDSLYSSNSIQTQALSLKDATFTGDGGNDIIFNTWKIRYSEPTSSKPKLSLINKSTSQELVDINLTNSAYTATIGRTNLDFTTTVEGNVNLGSNTSKTTTIYSKLDVKGTSEFESTMTTRSIEPKTDKTYDIGNPVGSGYFRNAYFNYVDLKFQLNNGSTGVQAKDYNNNVVGYIGWTGNDLQIATKSTIASSNQGIKMMVLDNEVGKFIYNSSTDYGFITGGKVEAQWFNATSDLRLKENIKSFEPHKSILDLPVVEFDYKKDGSHHIGCIAQDLQEICPEIVHENIDGYLTIEENKIVYLLLEEVKELKKELKMLKGE